MPQDGRLPSDQPHPPPPHPPWCALDDTREHDPHESARLRVDADHPSDTTIDAYLIRLDHRSVPEPVAVIELNYPGDETAVYLLTLGQIRRLEAALGKLRHLEKTLGQLLRTADGVPRR